MSACTSTPVSWLKLERYALGELTGPARADVEAHLAACPACASCLRLIEADAREPLPALPAARESAATRAAWRPRRWPAAAFALAAAAGVLAVLALSRVPPRAPADGDGPRAKGEVHAFSLVRDDGMVFDGERAPFRDGDRFKVLVSCTPGARAHVDFVVEGEEGPSFPLVAATIECGNAAVLPGALRLTGRVPMRACVAWSDQPVERERLRRRDPGLHALCKNLEPAP